MTITKAEILAHLNKELERNETDIDEYILSALKDLSLQDDFLWLQTEVDTIVGRPYYSLPLDYKRQITIKIDDNRPLGKITWKEYQVLIRDETSNDYDLPNRFAIHGDFWYPYPTPDEIYTATLFYNAFILESEDGVNAVDDITFKDIYRDAINSKTKAQFCRSLGWIDMAIKYETEYRQLILPPLKKLIPRETKFVQYNEW